MIDIHCHILHGLDDGPRDLNGCLDMVNTAVASGITHIFASPHHLNGHYENPKQVVLDKISELNQNLLKENIPLTVHPGQELRLHRELLLSLERDEVLTLDDKGKYLLVELPSEDVPAYMQEIVYELLLIGIVPIIVHPERNWKLFENPNLLFSLVQEGALTQLTSGSIIGHFGKKIKLFSEKILDHHLAHFIASDAHNTLSRGFTLGEAYASISKKFGEDRTIHLIKNTELLLNEQLIDTQKPTPIRKKMFRFF